uniref:MSP domain-containing protein n=1 Tax=Panagrellus redivivus TaxID=6233 RepID=A0A7E4WBB0_PANRE
MAEARLKLIVTSQMKIATFAETPIQSISGGKKPVLGSDKSNGIVNGAVGNRVMKYKVILPINEAVHWIP